MTIEEAIDKQYAIIVADDLIARQLKKRYKRPNFGSINAMAGRYDGYKGMYVDESLKSQVDKSNLKIYGHDIVFGKVPSYEY